MLRDLHTTTSAWVETTLAAELLAKKLELGPLAQDTGPLGTTLNAIDSWMSTLPKIPLISLSNRNRGGAVQEIWLHPRRNSGGARNLYRHSRGAVHDQVSAPKSSNFVREPHMCLERLPGWSRCTDSWRSPRRRATRRGKLLWPWASSRMPVGNRARSSATARARSCADWLERLARMEAV